jgi:hypothetical protein
LKKITPEGNNPTFTNGQVVTDVITTVPANSATYRRWFIKARMGIKKRFGKFSTPGETDYNSGRFPYEPDAGGSGAQIINTQAAILKLDFQTLVTPNNGFLLSRTLAPMDFGIEARLGTTTVGSNLLRLAPNIGSSGQLDLGLLGVVENTVTTTTDVETFVWQSDPT